MDIHPVKMTIDSSVMRQNKRLKVFVVILTVLLILVTAALVAIFLNPQNSSSNNTANQDTEDMIDEVPEDTEIGEPTIDNSVTYSAATVGNFTSDTFNFSINYDEAYGVVTAKVEGIDSEICTKETLSFGDNAKISVTVFEDHFNGAETCVPGFGGTELNTYVISDLNGNDYSVYIMNGFGSLYARASTSIDNGSMEEPKYEVLVHVTMEDGDTEETLSEKINSIVEGINFSEGSK